jgi:hypothetical protein
MSVERAILHIRACTEGFIFRDGRRVRAEPCEVDYDVVAELTGLRGVPLNKFVASTQSDIVRGLLSRNGRLTPTEAVDRACQDFAMAILAPPESTPEPKRPHGNTGKAKPAPQIAALKATFERKKLEEGWKPGRRKTAA